MPSVKTYRKLDENTVEITETITTTVISTYTINDLISQRDGLISQKDSDSLALDKKILEINTLIDTATQLGVVNL